MRQLAAIGTVLLLLAGCGDTWDSFMPPDFGSNGTQDRAVSADRTPGPSMADPTASAGGCYSGRLTAEGQTCQAMRTEDDDLLMLAGPRRGFGTGDSVCVCGIPAAEQFCGQGTTLLIREIDVDCRNIR